MRALLNWGAFSQARFGDATSVLANTGLFERNTNSINGVNSIPYSEGTVTHGTNIKGGTMNLSLEPNNIAIHFYVNYDGEGTPSATVSKDGEEAVPTEITKTDKGSWLVRVANVPANMFDTPYTVTVTDGTGDTFTATKTVREYLGTLLAQCNATENDNNAADDDKAVAKASGKVVRAMYQLYQFTTGKTGADVGKDQAHKSADHTHKECGGNDAAPLTVFIAHFNHAALDLFTKDRHQNQANDDTKSHYDRDV
jgi:hypothetical protein